MRTRLFASRGRAGGAGTRRRVVRPGTYPAGRYGRRGAAGRGVLCRAGRIPGGTFFGDDIDPGLLRREMERIYDFPLPLRRVGSRYTLELFHGPTFAFKDYGAGFMGRMIGLMGGAGEKLVILTATSGDTGSAVAHGFYGVPGVEVVLLYPEGKISRLQECQMTTLGGNIHPLRVAGTFDDCQRLVKGCLPTQNSVRGTACRRPIRSTCCAGYRRHSIISTAIACGGSRRAADGLWSWCRAVTTETSRPGCSPAAWGSPRRIRRGFEPERRGARVPAQRRVPSEAVGADAGQCDGRRSAEQFRTYAVALRR